VFLFAFSLAVAQTGTSTIRGEISDAQGKMVGGATVTLKTQAWIYPQSDYGYGWRLQL